MKFTFLFLLSFFSFNSYASKDVLQIAEKYCNQKVERACYMVNCHKKPETCKDDKPDKEFVEETHKKMKEYEKSCPKDDLNCMIQKVQEEAEAPLKELEKECNKGKKESCFDMEFMKAMPGLTP